MFTIQDIKHLITLLINEDEFVSIYTNGNESYIENRCNNTNIDLIIKVASMLSNNIEYYEIENFEITKIEYEYKDQLYILEITKYFYE